MGQRLGGISGAWGWLTATGFRQGHSESSATPNRYFSRPTVWRHSCVRGVVPEDKDPESVDAKLIEKYSVDRSKWGRSIDAENGVARMQYIRHERTFLLIATHGTHRFFEDENGSVRDARKSPIKYAGYSISYRRGQDG